MAGPRYLGINNIIDPTEGARRALGEVGAIYRDYDEQARKNEESNRQREEYARLTNERKVLSEYNPTVGDNFFGIDMDTQNHVRQAEARAIERNNALRASGDASALSDEALQQKFLTNRSQLADRDTVFRDVYNELVSQNVSDESAQRRAAMAASGYGSTSDLAAAEQAAVEARNKMAVERAKLIAGYDKTDATNLTNLTRTAISANNRSSGSGSGSSGKSSSTGTSSKSPYPTPDVMQKTFELAGDMAGSSDGKIAIQSLIGGIDLMQKAADEENQRRIAEARKNGTNLRDVPLVQVPDWETVQREFTGTFRPNWLNDRFAYNTPEDVVVDFLTPIQQRMELQAEVARTSRPSTSGSGGAGGGRISLDNISPIQANRAAVLQQPAVARQLTELNRDRVNSLYGQYMEEATQATPNRAPADTRTSSSRVSTPQVAPQARPQTVPQTSTPTNSTGRTLGTPPPMVRAANENTRAAQPERVSVTQMPDLTNLSAGVAQVARSVVNEFNNPRTSDQRKVELRDIAQNAGFWENIQGNDSSNLARSVDTPSAEYSVADIERFRLLRAEAERTGVLRNISDWWNNTPANRDRLATDNFIRRSEYQRFLNNNPGIAEASDNYGSLGTRGLPPARW